MIFLGLASNFSGGQTLRQLFAWGGRKHSTQLKLELSQKYQSSTGNVSLYHTGRSALAAGFRAVGSNSSKVIVPGLTCIAVIRAVRAAGFEPVYADIDTETLQYNWGSLEYMLDKNDNLCYNGSIIVAQNTLGLPLDMQKLEQIAQKHSLRIVEDLAHSAGRFYPDGREMGTVGLATVLSFGKGKAIDTSEGGALILRDESLKLPPEPTNRPKLSDTMRDRWYPVFGMLIRGGYHIRLGKIITAILVKLHFIARSADAQLDEAVRLTHWQAKLASKQLKRLPHTPLREFVLVRDRDKLLRELAEHGNYLQEIWYDTPVAPARYLDEADFPEHQCPHTVEVAKHIVNLPSWYSSKRLQPARDLIKTYELEEKHGA